MWFLSELEIETKIPEHIIFKYFTDNGIYIGSYASGNKFLGFGVSDEAGNNYLKIKGELK